MIWRGLFLPFVALVVACGGDEPQTFATFAEACAAVEGCETPEMAVAGPREAIWRVLVVREPAGAYRIEAVEEVEVAAMIGRPGGPLSGDVGLAAVDASGAPLELQLLVFPDVLELEAADLFEQARVVVDVSAEEVDTVGYLQVSGDVETLAVVDASGTMLASQPAPAPGEAVGGVGGSSEALTQASSASACAHVMLIENNGDERWFPRVLYYQYPLQTPTPYQRATVAAALGRMTPMLCAGVSRIAFTDFGDLSGTAGMVVGGFGDVVMINATVEHDGDLIQGENQLASPINRANLEHTIFHESAHGAERLLNHAVGVDGRTGTGLWDPSERLLAGQIIRNARMHGGFGERWLALHQSFMDLGWAGPHLLPPHGNGNPTLEQKLPIRAMSPLELARYGMISHYATKFYGDDIADTVGWAMSAPLRRAAGVPTGPPPNTNDYGCIAMRDHTERSIPQSLSVVYSKLAFLRDVGLISEEVFESCAGTQIGLPVETEGVAIFEDGELQRRFANSPEATIGTVDDRYVFTMTVGGMASFADVEYPATLRLELDLGPTSDADGPIQIERISWPRGLFSLGIGEPNYFQLRMPEAVAGEFDVYDGFVLVTEATNERIVGSVVVREAIRLSSPVPVPQVWDPPIQFRFLLEN